MASPALSPAQQPYDFSPATTAALVALLASKADDGKFAIATAATKLRFSGYAPTWGTPYWPPPLTFPPTTAAMVRPLNASSALLYSWRAHYRGRRQGGQLCADSSQDSLARGLLAQQALEWMNAVDLRYPVSPTPNVTPDVAGLAVDAQGKIVGRLLGYTRPWVDPK